MLVDVSREKKHEQITDYLHCKLRSLFLHGSLFLHKLRSLFLQTTLFQRSAAFGLDLLCKLSRNQSTGLCFNLFAMIQTCSYLFSSSQSP